MAGNEPQTGAHPDTSTSSEPASQAYNTREPEAGGHEHVDTVPLEDAQVIGSRSDRQPTSSHSSAMGTSGFTPGGSTDFPSTARSEDGSGAVVGQTMTYSSRPLATGDPTGSIVDHQSDDPMTYRRPEAGSHASPSSASRGTNTAHNSGGTSSSAAARSASDAWSTQKEGEILPTYR